MIQVLNLKIILIQKYWTAFCAYYNSKNEFQLNVQSINVKNIL